MLKLSICPAVSEDADAIAALNESCFGIRFPAEKVKKQLARLILLPTERVFVAVYRGRLIGFAHASSVWRTDCAPYKEIRAIAVEKEYRRKGVGRALWQAVEEWATEEHCETVVAVVGGSRSAQAFCAACGCDEQQGKKQYMKTVAAADRVNDGRKA